MTGARGWPVVLSDPGEGDRPPIALRPLGYGDQRAWQEVRARNADWLRRWEATMPPGATGRPPTFRALIARLRRHGRDGSAMAFAIDVEGRFAGQVSVNNIVRGSAQFASIGYWIDSAVAGRGVMPRAVEMVIDHCFGPVGLHRLEIAVRPENSSSLRVVEKLGVREVGFAPAYLHIDGAWRDHRIFAVTAEEWTERPRRP